jgi:hypothetical protein
MAELAVPIPMTPRTFYTDTALSQNKAKMDAIGKTFYKEIKAETLTKVPGSLIRQTTSFTGKTKQED